MVLCGPVSAASAEDGGQGGQGNSHNSGTRGLTRMRVCIWIGSECGKDQNDREDQEKIARACALRIVRYVKLHVVVLIVDSY